MTTATASWHRKGGAVENSYLPNRGRGKIVSIAADPIVFKNDLLFINPVSRKMLIDLVGGFLTLVARHGNGVRSHNTRPSAIHSVCKYVAVDEPELLYHCR